MVRVEKDNSASWLYEIPVCRDPGFDRTRREAGNGDELQSGPGPGGSGQHEVKGGTKSGLTIEEFGEIISTRIPTAAEFVAFVRGQGWGVHARDGKAFLRGPVSDPLLQKLAKMLSREPYRSQVLAMVESRPIVALTQVERQQAADEEPIRVETCRQCRRNVFPAVREHGCSHFACPYIPRDSWRRN